MQQRVYAACLQMNAIYVQYMQKQSSQQTVKSLNSAVHHSESGMGEYNVMYNVL